MVADMPDDVTGGFSSTPFSPEFDGTLGFPRLLSGKDSAAIATSHWHMQCNSILMQYGDQAAKSFRTLVPKIIKDKGTHCYMTVSPSPFQLETDELIQDTGSDNFLGANDPITLFCVQKNHVFDCSVDVVPFPGVSRFLTVTNGSLYALVVPVGDVMAAGGSIRTLMEAKGTDKNIRKLPQFLIPAGTSLFIPFGHEAVVIGIANEDESNDEIDQNWLAYYLTMAFDPQADAKFNVEERLHVASQVTQTLARSKKTFDGYKSDILKWKKALEDI